MTKIQEGKMKTKLHNLIQKLKSVSGDAREQKKVEIKIINILDRGVVFLNLSLVEMLMQANPSQDILNKIELELEVT